MTTSYTTRNLPPAPLPESDVPLMGNPILTRRVAPKRSANIGWYVGVPVAFVAVGALAFMIANGAHNQPSLMTTTTATTTEAAATPAPTPAPVAIPAAPAQVATASPTEAPVGPPAAITLRSLAREDHAAPVHRTVVRHARAAEDSGADASTTAPITPPAPQVARPPATEAAPPVLNAPPPSQ